MKQFLRHLQDNYCSAVYCSIRLIFSISNLPQSDCLSLREMASVQPLMGKLEDVLLPALHRQAGLYQCGDSSFRYLLVTEIQELLLQQDSSLVGPCRLNYSNSFLPFMHISLSVCVVL